MRSKARASIDQPGPADNSISLDAIPPLTSNPNEIGSIPGALTSTSIETTSNSPTSALIISGTTPGRITGSEGASTIQLPMARAPANRRDTDVRTPLEVRITLLRPSRTRPDITRPPGAQ